MKVTAIKYLIITVLIQSSVFITTAQNYKESVLIADEAFLDGDYYTASLYYGNAIWYDSSDLKIVYRCAESSRLFNYYYQAKQWYQLVLTRDKNREFPLAVFWLAMMQKSVEEYENAYQNFKTYYNQNSQNINDYYVKKSRVEMDACTEAPQLIQNEKNVLIEHLTDSKINTPYSEFNARQLGDTMLVFSALRPILAGSFDTYIPNSYISKIYQAIATNSGWSKTSEFESKINDKEAHNANICFGVDNNTVYFSRSRSDDNHKIVSEIYTSEIKDGKWLKAAKLPDKINTPGYTTTQPFIYESNEYKVLLFVSDRPGGFGKLDIWYSIIKDNKYHDPVNLGSNINTPGDEVTPFYHVPTQTLYFSSDWHKGLGGLDIFYSKGALNSWTNLNNVGYPINSSSNDLYFVINSVDNDGYLTSNRKGSLFIHGETCCNDIYSYEWNDTTTTKQIITTEIIPDTLNIEETIKEMLPITLYFHNDEPDPKSRAIITSRNYQNLLKDYYAMKDIYKSEYSKGLSGKSKIQAENDIADFFENYVAKGFSNLKLFTSLLLQDLSDGNKVTIKIKGYCSPLTTTEYNLNLAKRRINSIINFIRQFDNGIFKQFIDGTATNQGKLIFIEEPLGETTASKLVSDNPNDKRNSIYSRAAAFERKIQIILYDSEKKDNSSNNKDPQISFIDSVYDFNNLKFGEKASCVFKYQNIGNQDLLITGVETSCGCTSVEYSKAPLKPGNEATFIVNLNTSEDFGTKNETVTVYSNSAIGKTILRINAFILPPP